MKNEPISLVISGPIKSRLTNKISEEDIRKSIKIFRKINVENEVIFSTYKNEIPKYLYEIADNIVINKDPGPDRFKLNPWPISNEKTNVSNISRMLTTTVNGIKSSSNKIIIKSRIELLPNDENKFRNQMDKILNEINLIDTSKIVFLTEHFTGISFVIDGTLAVVPDTFQIASKETILRLWSESDLFWKYNKKILTRKKIKFPITNEQLLGFNYLNLYCNFPLEQEKLKLKKYYFSMPLIKSQILAEKNNYHLFDYKTFGLSVNYFSGSFAIKTSEVANLENKKTILNNLIVVLLKQIKHLIRKFIVSFKQLFHK